MKKEDNLSLFHRKTYRIFLQIFFLALLISFIFSLIRYNPKVIKPDFFVSYLFHQTLLCFAGNFTLIIYFFLFCSYSLFFNEKYLITPSGKKYMFHQIASAGFNIIIISVFFYFFSLELLIPNSKSKLEHIINQCQLADNFLTVAKQYDEKGEWENALSGYENYAKIIPPSKGISDKIRTLRVELSSIQEEEKPQSIIPDNLLSYEDLAEYYYREGDYFSAWFYYLYLEKGTPANQKAARNKIENIRNILQYRNSLMTDDQWKEFIDGKTKQMQNIYQLLDLASQKMEQKEYLPAYFLYCDALKINRNIRDAQIGKEESLKYLANYAVNLDEIKNASYYTGKENFLMFYSDRLLMKIGTLRQFVNLDLMTNQYFFFDTQLYFLDRNQNIEKIIFCKYGKLVNKKVVFLAYDEENRNDIFLPVIQSVEKTAMEKLVSQMPRTTGNDFLHYYQLNGENSYQLKTTSDEELQKLGAITNRYKLLQAELPHHSLPFTYDMEMIYNLSYDYQNASGFSIWKLLDLYHFYHSKENDSLGFFKGFIGSAIAEKISKVFLFLSLSFLFLALFLKYRPKEYQTIYLFLIPFVLCALYLTVILITFFSTMFFNILGSVLNLSTMFVLSISLNLIILLSILFYITGFQIENE